jgi:hypothetical protein
LSTTKPFAAHDPALAHEEHLDGGLEVVLGEAEHVEVLVAVAHHLLLGDGLADALELVADASRPLELELARRGAHLGLEPLDQGVGLAVEEVDQLLGELLVGLPVDLAHARPGALLDVEQQAGSAEPLVAAELVVRAGAQREGPQQQVEGLADGVGVGVGAEVLGALALAAPHHHRPGPVVGDGDGEERVALVVAEPDVEAGPVLLDQVVLEHEGLDVVADLDPLDGLGRGHHLGRARVHVARVLEVVRQALAQVARLADVDHPAVRVLELVRAGRLRDRAGGGTLDHGTRPSPAVRRRSRHGDRPGVRRWTWTSTHRPPPAWSPAHLNPRTTSPWRGDQAVPTGLNRFSTPSEVPDMLRLQLPLPERYTDASDEELATRIAAAKATLGERLFILGHHYQRDEVIRFADARGDSYRLSVLAQERPRPSTSCSAACTSWPSRPTSSPATTSR